MRARTRRKLIRWGIVAGLVGLVTVFIASFALTSVLRGGVGDSGGGISEPVEGVGTPVAIVGAGHVPEGQTVSYSTTPPTSGPHWREWADCGTYDEGIPDERIVHNLEHGNVVISYNLPDPEESKRFKKVVEGLSARNVWGIVRSYSEIEPGTVAMAAWGIIDEFQGVDQGRIETFFDTYRGYRGAPELVPC